MPHAIANDGSRLYYQVHGAGAQTLILLHGMGSSDAWRPLLPYLDREALRVVTCDLRGHGQSDRGAGRFTYIQLNADLAAVADAAGAKQFVAVGFSGGCKNAVCFAAAHPQRVRGLVLVAPPGFGTVPVPREAFAGFGDYLQQRKTVPPEFEAWFTDKAGGEKESAVRALVATPRDLLDASAELWLYTPVLEEARRITCPVLVVAAAQEVLYHVEYQRQTTLATLPQAEMVVLDCGHFIPYEAPAALVVEIDRFCRGLSST